MSNFLNKFDVFLEMKRAFASLSRREKWLLISALSLTAVVILDLGVIAPLYSNSKRLKKEVQTDKSALIEMQKLYAEHKKYEASLRGNESVPKDFSIMTYLQSVANAAGVSYDSIQPRSSSDNSTSYVDVRLKNINLYQLTNLLFKIEIGGQYQLKIKRLNVRTSYSNPSMLDVGLQVVMPGSANE
jgi:type II secretory pathway component PulM